MEIRKRKCLICHEMFSDSMYLQEHSQLHFHLNQFSCKFCPKLLKTRQTLRRHLGIFHSRDNEVNDCQSYKTKNEEVTGTEDLENHQMNFSVNTDYDHRSAQPKAAKQIISTSRPKDSLNFPMILHVKNHSQIQATEKPFQCEHCPRAFVLQSHLKSHLVVHRKERYENTNNDKKRTKKKKKTEIVKKKENLNLDLNLTFRIGNDGLYRPCGEYSKHNPTINVDLLPKVVICSRLNRLLNHLNGT